VKASGPARVAITGLGLKSPAGCTTADAFNLVLAGHGTARELKDMVVAESRVIGCRVPAFRREGYFTIRELRGLDTTTIFGIAAAVDAVADAGLSAAALRESATRWGVLVGTGGAGLTAETDRILRPGDGTAPRIGANSVPTLMPSATGARISIRLGITGASFTVASACASAATAIGEAMRMVRGGLLDGVITGGTEAPISPAVLEGFHRLAAMSRRTADPAAASRPFDADRDGFVMGEGAAFLVLERMDLAIARGAHIYAELAGYGTNCDAYHIVAPIQDGSAASACIDAALDDANLLPGEIGHISAHGTSTIRNDHAEACAIVRCFGETGPPVTAVKGAVGHMMGAAGAFAAVISAMSVDTGLVPPIANHERQEDDGPRLDIVTGTPRKVPSGPALLNAFGFGGHNTCLVLRPAEARQ